ncbi:MAG TPA: arginase family protein [Terriglobales bacterium]|nr:arginase family protein [Terriglobales bacterium]
MIDVTGLPVWGGLPEAEPEEASIVVAGIPYDRSAVYRGGAAEAPAAIRRLSAVMPPLDERGRHLDGLTLHDLGDLDLGASVEHGWRAVADRLAAVPTRAFLTVLGGDHCSAIPVLVAQTRRHAGLAVLWVDAHPDLCDISRGGRWTVGCALRRAVELGGLDPGSIVLAGCRDFDAEEVAYVRSRGILLVTAAELAAEPAAAVSRVTRALQGRRLHVSFDIDVLDPAFAPGTEVPAAGGLSTREALRLLETATRLSRPVGLDVCEVSPPLDQAGVTSLAALKVVFETWSRLPREGRGSQRGDR